MKMKQVKIKGKQVALISYKNIWVFPLITVYQHGLGSPIAILLYTYKKGELEYYCDVTVNLPECSRKAGCQFIETNKNGEDILAWLQENSFGELTNENGVSGFCTYPLFNFYKGEKYWEYRKINEELDLFNE